jgi:uncharacterized protein (DUF1697 family)
MALIIALIRGINVGSTRKLPMADLRAACADAGLGPVATYIQSGNLVLEHDDRLVAEQALETLIATRFKLDVPVVVRTAATWNALTRACPFLDLAEAQPRNLHILVCKRPPTANAVDALIERARDGEKIAHWGDEIAIHFTNGAGASRLSPMLIDRLIGAPATARNWNTVLKLREMTTELSC